MALLHDRELTAAFDRAARAYDRLVGANPGYHTQLRRSVGRMRLPAGGRGLRLLDVGCGTGASTAALLQVLPLASVTAVDASAGMLERAAAKSWPASVSFFEAPVESLGAAGVDGPFDAVFAAYLLRNVSDPDKVLRTLRGVLRPGGLLAVHEYTPTDSPVRRALWSAVCWGIVIPAGALGPGGPGLYRHLWRSALDFDTPSRLRDRLVRAGFRGVRSAPVTGWQRGIVHTFLARRPDGPAGR